MSNRHSLRQRRVDDPEFLVDFVDDAQLARRLKKHPRTIYRWTLEPDGLPYLKLGMQRLYHLPTVDAWLISKIHNPNPRRTHSAKAGARRAEAEA